MCFPSGKAARRRGVPLTAAGVVLVAVLSAVSALASGTNQRSVWYETLLGGVRVGTSHETVAEERDSLLVTTVESRVVVERFSERTEMERDDRWVETRDGRPVSYHATVDMSGEETSLAVRPAPGGLSVTRRSGARADSSFVGMHGRLLFPRGIDGLHAERGFTPGDTYSYRTFDPDFEAVASCSVSVTGVETLELAGQLLELHVVDVTPDLYGGVVLREWRDDAGRLWAQSAGGLATETRRTTEREALEEVEPPDIMSSTFVRSNAVIPNSQWVEQALYEVWVEDGDVAPFVEDPPRQVVEGRTGRGVMLRVRRLVPDAAAEVGTAAPEYLEDNALLQKDDPAVVDAARRAADESGAGAWERSVAIEAAVHKLVRDRGFGTGFGSAAEALRTGSGDCSEHAVLAVAMERALGIPSRVVTGVVHFRGGFAYHMWVEVRVGDGWYALDPTMGLGRVDATHIRLGTSALAGGSIGELSLPILETVNRLGIRVVEYTTAGVTTTVDRH